MTPIALAPANRGMNENKHQRMFADRTQRPRITIALTALLTLLAVPLAAQTQLPSATESAAEVGFATAVDGFYAATGAPGAGQNRGQVLLYVCAGQHCSGPELVSESGLAPGALFGSALSISGQTLVVGAPGDAAGGIVYVYLNDGANWQLQQAITADSAGPSARFGHSVAIEGERIIVGAPGAASRAGAAFIFERSAGSWTQTARLDASDAGAGHRLGSSVAISGDSVIVGAPNRPTVGSGNFAQGAGYVYVHDGSWSEQALLFPQFAVNGAQFGFAVDLDADRALVGAPAAAARSGSAYLYTRSGTLWTQQAQLSSPAAAPGDRFGWSLAIDGDRLLVGSPYALASCGQVSEFVRNGNSWSWVDSRLNAPTLGGLAGWSVALSATRSLVGLPGFDGAPSHQGAAYWRDSADAVFAGGFETGNTELCVLPAD